MKRRKRNRNAFFSKLKHRNRAKAHALDVRQKFICFTSLLSNKRHCEKRTQFSLNRAYYSAVFIRRPGEKSVRLDEISLMLNNVCNSRVYQSDQNFISIFGPLNLGSSQNKSAHETDCTLDHGNRPATSSEQCQLEVTVTTVAYHRHVVKRTGECGISDSREHRQPQPRLGKIASRRVLIRLISAQLE